MAEHLAVNQGVVGSSPIASAIYGLLEKRLNSHAFHACIHGFESRTGHQMLQILNVIGMDDYKFKLPTVQRNRDPQ